jgi:hypothetical protein
VPVHSVVVRYNRKTNTGHSRQIFTGFCELARHGAIELRLVEDDWNPAHETLNLIRATLDGDIELLFDTNDGFYWIHDDIDANIRFFSENILPKFRYVYKRSCNPAILARFGEGAAKFRPLGLNYEVTSAHNAVDAKYFGWSDFLTKQVRRSDWACRLLGKTPDGLFDFENFEYPPLPDGRRSPPQVLLLTRLWEPTSKDPGEPASPVREKTHHELDVINRTRIECVQACRNAFAGHFVGGLVASPYAEKVAPHLIAPAAVTNKQSFMALVKASPICVATTGLIMSTGWRFGEYVAASRAIVSERLHDELPGSFGTPGNYLEFSTVDGLLQAVQRLSDDRSALKNMMWNNFRWYRTHGRPDTLVLNALVAALD